MFKDFWSEYLHILSDPAHMMAEITFMLIIDVIVLGAVWPLMKKAVHRTVEKRVQEEHAVIDTEHGVSHSETGEA